MDVQNLEINVAYDQENLIDRYLHAYFSVS